jgi:transcriptional regulator with XRE-family HTH domain
MQSIGERLEEARKRKGISLREAAEATKIRSDFLGYIEQNTMDFELPELYKRGFLKNYARYLRLDVDQIMADYHAQRHAHDARPGKKGGGDWFGQLEIKKAHHTHHEESETKPESETAAPYGRIAAKSVPSEHAKQAQEEANSARTQHGGDHADEDSEGEETDKTFYIKIGLIFAGTLALVFVVFGLIWSILGSGSEDTAELRPPAQVAENSTPVDNNSITLIASGNVYVLVKQQTDNKELYRKTMSEGESVTLQKDGPVDILFTAGENILIETGGERLRPSSSGTAKITIQ